MPGRGRALTAGVLAALALLASGGVRPAWAVYHANLTVADVHSPDARTCTFFMLTGVGQADPVNPGSPWFGVPKTHAGYREIVSILMAARLTGRPVNVTTTGQVVCGVAGVNHVDF
jgi:hypothetical protein